MTLTVHQHPFSSYCWKALIALHELDLPFEPVQVDDEADRRRLAELWPMGGMPVLVDSEAGVVLPESSAIIEYVDALAGGGRLVPADGLRVRLWDRIFDTRVMTPMQKIVADSLRPDDHKDAYGVDEARATLDAAYRLVDQHMRGQEWAGGPEFTLADCAAAPSLFYARVVHRWDEDELEHLTSFFERLMARASVARVVDEARPLRHLFPLPWPDYVA